MESFPPINTVSFTKETMKLKSIYNTCLREVGGIQNEDVQWYLNDRPKKISRSSFFEAAVFAIWVSGLKRKSVESFLANAEKNGFSWNYLKMANIPTQKWIYFKRKLHGRPVPKIVNGKWDSIRQISQKLHQYQNELDFRNEWFSKKILSSRLDNIDIDRLRKMKLGYIGPANSHFIIRNMGGEALKRDRWIEAFLNYYHLSSQQLIDKLNKLGLAVGLFDLVIWAYCEKQVKKVSNFNSHFKKVFV